MPQLFLSDLRQVQNLKWKSLSLILTMCHLHFLFLSGVFYFTETKFIVVIITDNCRTLWLRKAY